jgi:carbamoyltransferase
LRALGINAVFHDSAAALVVDGRTVAAAEEERFSRRKHGKRPVPFSAWELPEQAIRWCLAEGGLTADDLDAVAYSYDPALVDPDSGGLDPSWEDLRTTYAARAPQFLKTALPGYDGKPFHFVRHHVAHAASAALAAPWGPDGTLKDCAVLAVDGRGESTSMLAGEYRDRKLDILKAQSLPHSLGLLYEDLTAHLGFERSSDEYKVMAMASYGAPLYLDHFRQRVYATPDGGFRTDPVDWNHFAPAREAGDGFDESHADLAASVQVALEEVLLDLCNWLYGRTGNSRLAFAGGVALNCVANTRLLAESPFEEIWVQPAAGDSGTALGAALTVAAEAGDDLTPMTTAALGRGWSDTQIELALSRPACRTSDRLTSPRQRRRSLPTMASSPGSRAELSTGRGPSGVVRCSPTPPARTTPSGSMTSRAASSSGPWLRWCSATGHPRSSRVDRFPARTCSSCTMSRATGTTGYGPSPMWTAPRASRPSMQPMIR